MTLRQIFVMKTVAALTGILFISGSAGATLGEKIDGAETRQAKQKVTHKSRTQNAKGYSVDVSTTDAGTIRQFIRGDGTVFAIAWKGVSNPDMAGLLGSFNSSYVQSAQAKQVARRSRVNVVEAPGLVVRKTGNMRAWRLQIIATNLLPAGVTDEDIQ